MTHCRRLCHQGTAAPSGVSVLQLSWELALLLCCSVLAMHSANASGQLRWRSISGFATAIGDASSWCTMHMALREYATNSSKQLPETSGSDFGHTSLPTTNDSTATTTRVLVDVSVGIFDGATSHFETVACQGEPADWEEVMQHAGSVAWSLVFPFMFDPNDCVERFLLRFRGVLGNTSILTLSGFTNTTSTSSTLTSPPPSTCAAVGVWQLGSVFDFSNRTTVTCDASDGVHQEGNLLSRSVAAGIPAFCAASPDNTSSSTGELVENASFYRLDLLGPRNVFGVVSSAERRIGVGASYFAPLAASTTTGASTTCSLGSLVLWSPLHEIVFRFDVAQSISAECGSRNGGDSNSSEGMCNYVPLRATLNASRPQAYWPQCLLSLLGVSNDDQSGSTSLYRFRLFMTSATELRLVRYGIVGAAWWMTFTACSVWHFNSLQPHPCTHPLWRLPEIIANGTTGLPSLQISPPLSYCGTYGGIPFLRLELRRTLNVSQWSFLTDVHLTNRGYSRACREEILQLRNISAPEWFEGDLATDPGSCLQSLFSTVGMAPWVLLRYSLVGDRFTVGLPIGMFFLTPCGE